MADHSYPRGNTGTSGDHKGLIYAITGGILAVGLLLMAFYDRAGDPGPTASLQKPVVTAQK
jgi:hypothetical protein